MLIVAGSIQIDPGEVDSMRTAAAAMMEATRQEPGCIEYVFSVSVDDPGSVQIFEIWETAEDLERHFEMPHMATFRAALGELTVTSRSVSKYDVSSSTPL